MSFDLEDAAGEGLALEFGFVETSAGGGDIEGLACGAAEGAGSDLRDREVDLTDEFAGAAVEVEHH